LGHLLSLGRLPELGQLDAVLRQFSRQSVALNRFEPCRSCEEGATGQSSPRAQDHTPHSSQRAGNQNKAGGPAEAFYSGDLREFILAYDVVRQSSSPDGRAAGAVIAPILVLRSPTCLQNARRWLHIRSAVYSKSN